MILCRETSSKHTKSEVRSWVCRRHVCECDLDFQLLVQSVVDPQVDVASPVSLLLNGGDVGDGALINISDRVRVGIVLHQAEVVEPSIVVEGIRLDSQEEGVRLLSCCRKQARGVNGCVPSPPPHTGTFAC